MKVLLGRIVLILCFGVLVYLFYSLMENVVARLVLAFGMSVMFVVEIMQQDEDTSTQKGEK